MTEGKKMVFILVTDHIIVSIILKNECINIKIETICVGIHSHISVTFLTCFKSTPSSGTQLNCN